MKGVSGTAGGAATAGTARKRAMAEKTNE